MNAVSAVLAVCFYVLDDAGACDIERRDAFALIRSDIFIGRLRHPFKPYEALSDNVSILGNEYAVVPELSRRRSACILLKESSVPKSLIFSVEVIIALPDLDDLGIRIILQSKEAFRYAGIISGSGYLGDNILTGYDLNL